MCPRYYRTLEDWLRACELDPELEERQAIWDDYVEMAKSDADQDRDEDEEEGA
jgi:hypothetical protein